MNPVLTTAQLAALGRIDGCTLCNAIETFDVRLCNEGFCDSSIRCLFPELPPMVGYAVPVKIHCSSPPMDGGHYLDRTDWWNYILSIPAPRVVVLQDTDPQRGLGALLGEVHANILRALQCAGAVTDGAVRDVDALRASRFPCFAGHVAISHAYAHIVSIGDPVEIGRLKINAGDLLHGDQHGVVSVPTRLAPELPAVATRILAHDRRLIELCRADGFSLEKMHALVQELRHPA